MPKLTIDRNPVEVPAGKRLVNALIDEGKIDQLHACGGRAACTTCRILFVSGEPQEMTQAEKDVLAAKGLSTMPGVRLSCQMLCNHDMEVTIISRFEGSGRRDAGKRPADQIEPPPVWVGK